MHTYIFLHFFIVLIINVQDNSILKLRVVIQDMIHLFYVHFTSLNVENLKYNSENFVYND